MTSNGDLLLLQEVADLLRAPLSTVRHWVRVGRLKTLKPGRHPMVRRSELEAFLQRSEISTVPPKKRKRRRKLP